MDKKLVRKPSDKMIAGVCAGLANYFSIDKSLVRILFALGTFFTGCLFGVVAYIIMCIIIPEEN